METWQDQQMLYRKLGDKPVKAKGLLGIFNNFDIKEQCIACGGKNIIDLDWNKAPYDWQCADCKAYQLTYMKEKGFRLYAFLLDGSWTSKNFYARSLQEAYKLASRTYGQGRNGVQKSYMVGSVDCFVMSGWISF